MEMFRGNRHFLYNRAVFNKKHFLYVDEEQIYVIGYVKKKRVAGFPMKPIGDLYHTHHVYMCLIKVMTFDLLFDLHF